jgi:hypothetical protein
LGKVLIYDPDERLVPREALAHAFFQAEMPPPPRINENTDYLDDGETSPDIHKGTIPAPYGDLADSPSSE